MAQKQLLHLVIGGRVTDPQTLEFEDPNALHYVGMFPNYALAEAAWRSASQSKVDDAMYKYAVVHVHRLIDPDPTPDDED